MPELAVPTILAVEDDPFVRTDLRLILEGAGFDVCADARDGLEAVELARKHEPDAILLDLALPRLDGIEATRRILSERDVPIVALTGRSHALAAQALEAGATSYVLKPFVEAELVGALFDALAAHNEAAATAVRAQSRHAIAQLLSLLGYPEEWATDLESQAYATGRVWRIAPPRNR
jgi:CheY-like chemotaxis protein